MKKKMSTKETSQKKLKKIIISAIPLVEIIIALVSLIYDVKPNDVILILGIVLVLAFLTIVILFALQNAKKIIKIFGYIFIAILIFVAFGVCFVIKTGYDSYETSMVTDKSKESGDNAGTNIEESAYLASNANGITLNNMGYMYSKGLGVDVDKEKAAQYYYEASKLGCSYAVKNLAAFYILNPYTVKTYEQFLQALKKAYDLGDEQTKRFVSYIQYYKGTDSNISIKAMKELSKKFFNMPIEDQIKILEDNLVWESTGVRRVEHALDRGTDFFRVDLIGEYVDTNKNIYVYEIYYREFYLANDISFSDYISEEFISIQ